MKKITETVKPAQQVSVNVRTTKIKVCTILCVHETNLSYIIPV